jgi:hypothetical protein
MKFGCTSLAALLAMSSTAGCAFEYANAVEPQETHETTVVPTSRQDQVYVDFKDLRILKVKKLSDPVGQFYPAQAQKLGIHGRTAIDCFIGEKGKFEDCRVVEEDPIGYGFGAAAASFFGGGYIRADSVLNSGAPLPTAARVKFKFTFRMPQ